MCTGLAFFFYRLGDMLPLHPRVTRVKEPHQVSMLAQEMADGLASGDRVQVDTGEIYEYIGPERTGPVDLSSLEEDYGDDWSKWRQAMQEWLKENPD